MPGTGVFRLEDSSASINHLHNRLVAPQSQLVFEPGYPEADERLFQFLGIHLHHTPAEAQQQLEAFLQPLRSPDSRLGIGPAGVLHRDAYGQVIFEPAPGSQLTLPDLDLPAALHKHPAYTETEETAAAETAAAVPVDTTTVTVTEVQQSKAWIVWAIVIAVLSVAAILVNNFLLH